MNGKGGDFGTPNQVPVSAGLPGVALTSLTIPPHFLVIAFDFFLNSLDGLEIFDSLHVEFFGPYIYQCSDRWVM